MRVRSAFAIPAAPDATSLADALGRAGLSVRRARAAARLGNPDPYHVLALARTAPPGTAVRYEATARAPLDPDRPLVEALLRGADAVPASLLQPLGPGGRGVPVDLDPADPRAPALRWPTGRPAPRRRLGRPRRWSAEELGLPPVATIRTLCLLGDGRVAAGSDYGLVIGSADGFEPFPFPSGARREARHVEALAALPDRLVVATTRSWFEWDYAGRVEARGLDRDETGTLDDVRSLLAVGDRLIAGWRTRLDGGSGPPDAIALAADPEGVVYAGTLGGELHVVDGGGPIRTFGAPVRHLAFAGGALHVAAGGALHRFDGASWASEKGEPTALAADGDRLWIARDGVVDGVEVERPWCVLATRAALWVGAVGALVRVPW